MNEFLEQFLLEGRELIEQATADLLGLETPGQDEVGQQGAGRDKERLDSAFRSFHTLKGAAGIVDFPVMGHLMHAAEGVLDAVRAGDHPVTADLIGDCLACLDQVAAWLDQLQANAALPTVTDQDVAGIIARLEKSVTIEPETALSGPPALGERPAWVACLVAGHPAEHGRARVALRYAPAADSFFRGEDPLGLVARLPDLLALELAPAKPWPTLEALDPFACNLIVTALLGAAPEHPAALFGAASGQVEIWPLPASPAQADALAPEAAELLTEQMLLLANEAPEGRAGRVGSAGVVAARVLRHAGRPAEARAIEDAAARGQQAGNAAALLDALHAVMQPVAQLGPTAGPATEPPQREIAARALRVDVERIDALVTLTGELTVVKNAIGHAANLAQINLAQTAADRDVLAQLLRAQHALLDRLVAELQRSVVGIRVLPLRYVFQRFSRPVREMAQSLGKPVQLVTEGETTEADKVIVEALFEPLLHVLRNALDHGIEDAAARSRAGKPPLATVRLRAAREGDHIVVEVSDDGTGIDKARIRQVAAERGVASPEALAKMTDDALLELIFGAGFSTAARVTDVSGRGVGMDAVRAAIGRLGGRVSVRSREGEGTSIIFTLPFNVMISRVLTVEVGGQSFGIPLEMVVETLRIRRDRITRVGAAQAVVVHNRTVPLLSLADMLGLPSRHPDDNPEATIVVAAVGGQRGAVEVDRVGERLDVMLKPMDGLLAGMSGVAGTTLLGDGRVLIVLDLQDLLQ